MHHAFIDAYSALDTPLHRFNARLKIICLALFLLLIVLTPSGYISLFAAYALSVAILIYISRIPHGFILKKIIEILPFIMIIGLSALFKKGGLVLFLNCVLKAVLAMLLILLISSTTRFHQLLEALAQLKVPRLFINLLSFMYRYSYLLEDQFMKARRAYESRSVNGGNKFKKARILSNILGIIFIRTYERAERVYLAMCARGYDGDKGG